VSQIVDPCDDRSGPRLSQDRFSSGHHPVVERVLQVHGSLSFFQAVYDSFPAYRAAIIRLDG